MVPTSYTELFIFLIGAVGAALMLGTGAALMRFRRTGAFPGQDPSVRDGAHEVTDPPPGGGPAGDVHGALMRSVMTKCLVGGLVLAGAVGALWSVRS